MWLVIFPASAQPPSSSISWTPRDDDVRILEITVGPYTLENVILTYQDGTMILVPLGSLSELLDIAVESRPGDGVAEGFILKEERTFFLDTTRGEVTLKGKVQAYDPNRVHILPDDIYVDSQLLASWYSIQLDIDLFASRLRIISEELLPFEQRLERERRIAKVSAREPVERDYPRHYEPYKMWSVPFIDQTLRVSARKEPDGETLYPWRYTTYATADLLKMEAALYMDGYEEDAMENFRFTLGRKDPEAELLGPLKARAYALGSVLEPSQKLLTRPGKQQPGFKVSNYPLTRPEQFDRQTFIGDLPPGWQVELYRNNALIGFQQQATDGQYRFDDVPLLFGSNYFRLVFYGPQGQQRVEEYRYELGDTLTPPGQHNYRVVATEDEVEGYRGIAQYEAGLSKNWSAGLSLTSVPLFIANQSEQHNYLQAGLLSYWKALFFTLGVVDDTEGGSAFDWSFQTRYKSTIFKLEETYLNDFVSEVFLPTQTPIERRTLARLDTAIPPTFFPRIPVTFGYERDNYTEGGNFTRFTNQISMQGRYAGFTNNLTWQETTTTPELFTGIFALSYNTAKYGLRGTLNYEMKPRDELTNAALTMDVRKLGVYQLSLNINHSLELDVTQYTVSASKPVGNYALTLLGRYGTDDSYEVGLAFNISLGRDPRTGEWEYDARSMASLGSASAQVFLDSNQDGLLDENEEPLPNVAFALDGGRQPVRTNDNGVAFLTALPAHKPGDLEIAMDTLEDPLWIPAIDGVHIVPRPGQAMQLNFPIFMSGEIDGTVFFERAGIARGAGRVSLQLLDKRGRIVTTTDTAYDGFYVLSNVPVGKYQLRIAPEQIAELRLQAPEPLQVEVTTDELFVSGADFILKSAE
jgi:hypothetical protein